MNDNNLISKMEKVIKGLETSLSIGVCGKCVNECWYGDTIASCHDIIRDAIALLKAQEPVKPIRKVIGYGWRYFCGKCGNSIVAGQNFCQKCGRAVKWE